MNVIALSLFVYALTKAGMGHIWVFYFFYISAFFADCYFIGKFIVWKYEGKEEEENFDFLPSPPKVKRSPRRKTKNG